LAVQMMQVSGPMARAVADVRLALDVISGAHPRDPWSLDPPAEQPRDAAARRVAMIAEPPGGSTDSRVAETVRQAGATLREAGYVVEEVTPPRYEDAVSTWTALIVSDFRALTDQLLPIMGKDGAFFFQTIGASVPLLDAAGFSRLFFARDGVARAWSQFMAGYGLILSPTWTQLPFEEGFDAASEENVAATMEMIRPVVPANLIGLPSACVPAGLDPATGLPIGVLLTGRRMHDMECLDAAEAIEASFRLPTPIDPK
jgi:amidase